MKNKANGFIKQAVTFVFSMYNMIFFTILLATFILVYFFIDFNEHPQNVTWIYSSSMQTLAALIALLPVSYAYFINNVEEEKSDEYDSYVIEQLKKEVYYEMIFVIVFCLIIIIFNLIFFFIEYSLLNAYIVSFFTIHAIALLALYVYRLFDPLRVKDILQSFDTTIIDPNQKQVTLDEFITDYLALEKLVKDYISNEHDSELGDRLPLYDIVDNYSKDFEVIEEDYEDFKEIIFHRNNVIHNYTGAVIDFTKYQKILDLQTKYQRLNMAFISKNIFSSVAVIRNTVELTINEFVEEMDFSSTNVTTVKEQLITSLQTHFVSKYYATQILEDAKESDFEVIQNNYSNRKLVGIEFKASTVKNAISTAEALIDRLKTTYLYVVMIHFNIKTNEFTIYYNTLDNQIKNRKII
ncbi:MAG: hypothetical protein K9L26_04715 [Candidatus Izimaplasma sp.]|nr:hypothetical protein [Candidatus Izimaplasma bacterium]